MLNNNGTVAGCFTSRYIRGGDNPETDVIYESESEPTGNVATPSVLLVVTPSTPQATNDDPPSYEEVMSYNPRPQA